MSQLWWIVFQSLVVSSNHVTTLHVQQWLMGVFNWHTRGVKPSCGNLHFYHQFHGPATPGMECGPDTPPSAAVPYPRPQPRPLDWSSNICFPAPGVPKKVEDAVKSRHTAGQRSTLTREWRSRMQSLTKGQLMASASVMSHYPTNGKEEEVNTGEARYLYPYIKYCT